MLLQTTSISHRYQSTTDDAVSFQKLIDLDTQFMMYADKNENTAFNLLIQRDRDSFICCCLSSKHDLLDHMFPFEVIWEPDIEPEDIQRRRLVYSSYNTFQDRCKYLSRFRDLWHLRHKTLGYVIHAVEDNDDEAAASATNEHWSVKVHILSLNEQRAMWRPVLENWQKECASLSVYYRDYVTNRHAAAVVDIAPVELTSSILWVSCALYEQEMVRKAC